MQYPLLCVCVCVCVWPLRRSVRLIIGRFLFIGRTLAIRFAAAYTLLWCGDIVITSSLCNITNGRIDVNDSVCTMSKAYCAMRGIFSPKNTKIAFTSLAAAHRSANLALHLGAKPGVCIFEWTIIIISMSICDTWLRRVEVHTRCDFIFPTVKRKCLRSESGTMFRNNGKP